MVSTETRLPRRTFTDGDDFSERHGRELALPPVEHLGCDGIGRAPVAEVDLLGDLPGDAARFREGMPLLSELAHHRERVPPGRLAAFAP